MNLRQYNHNREIIKKIYDQIIHISNELVLIDVEKIAKDSLKSLEEECFNIVIVGEFSRGKSTFINALLGKRILPSSIKPTTTIINKVSYGDTPEYQLHFRDNLTKPRLITEQEFKNIIAKNEPPEDNEQLKQEYNENLELVSSIKYANIKYPTQICRESIEIVDTPGTNDLDQAREEITFEFIPKSDVAIMLLSANQILSDSEANFLRERIMDNDIKKVFFVINFKDRLYTEEDQNKVMEYATEHLGKIIPNPRIFMVSAKDALNYKRKLRGEEFKGKVPADIEETGFPEMESEITRYLSEERGNVKLQKYLERGSKLADELIKKGVNRRLSTLSISLKEFEEKIKNLQPQLRAISKKCNILTEQLNVRLTGLESNFISVYRSGLDNIAIQANLAINSYDGPLEVDNIAREIEKVVAPMQRELELDLKRYQSNFIDSELKKALAELQKIWDDVEFDLNKSLVPMSNKRNLIQIDAIGSANSENNDLLASCLAGGAIAVMFNMPFIVIPAVLFGGKFFNNIMANKRRDNFLSEVKIQVDKRYNQIIPKQVNEFSIQYKKTVESILDNLTSLIKDRISGLENQLNHLYNERKAEEFNVQKQQQTLSEQKKQIEEIKEHLRRLSNEL